MASSSGCYVVHTGQYHYIGGGGIGVSDEETVCPPTPAAPSIPTTKVGGAAVATGTINITSSTIGDKIPILFGTDAVTGNVIWASPVSANTASDGTQYSSVNFAVALCEGVIDDVLRIWIGGRLAYDKTITTNSSAIAIANATGAISSATVDLTDPSSPLNTLNPGIKQTTIAVYSGNEVQLPDPTISAALGGATPAYRGVAYIVFTNYLVSGLSLPSLQFECTSSSNNLIPRIYFDVTSPQSTLTTVTDGQAVLGDPSTDTIYVTGATATSVPGLIGLDTGTLTQTLVTSVTAPDISQNQLYRMSGSYWLALDANSADSGPIAIWNATTGAITDTFGINQEFPFAEGIISNFPSSQSAAVLRAQPGILGTEDIIMTCGLTSNSVCFISSSGGNFVTQTGVDGDQVTYGTCWSSSADWLTGQMFPVPILPSASSTSETTFSSVSVSADGGFFVLVTCDGTNIKFTLFVVTVGTTSVLQNVPYYTLGETNMTSIFGSAATAYIDRVVLDPTDLGLVVFLQPTDSTLKAAAFKYDPFGNAIRWTTLIPDQMIGTNHSPIIDAVTNSAYAFTAATSIIGLDLAGGSVAPVFDSYSGQSLPSPVNGCMFYNGYEGTVTYTSGVSGQKVVKVYVGRATGSSVALATIIGTLLDRLNLDAGSYDVSGLNGLSVLGYLVPEIKTLRDVLGELAQVFTFDVVESDQRIKFVTRGGPTTVTIPSVNLALLEKEGWFKETEANDFTRARKICITFNNADYSYFQDAVTYSLPEYAALGFENEAPIDVNTPIVLTDALAQKLGELLLYSKILYQNTYEFDVPLSYLWLDPSDVINVQRTNDTVTLRIRQLTIGNDWKVKVKATYEQPDVYTDQLSLSAPAPLSLNAPNNLPVAPSRVDLVPLEIPWRSYSEGGDTVGYQYVPFVALNYKYNNVLGNAMTVIVDGTTEQFAPPNSSWPTHGTTVTTFSYRGSYYSIDDTSAVIVAITCQGDVKLGSVDQYDMINNQNINLAYIGGELVQFATVTALPTGNYMLQNFVRGLHGTDTLVNSHATGEVFVLIGDSSGNLTTAWNVAEADISVPAQQYMYPSFDVYTYSNTGNPAYPNGAYHFDPLTYRCFSVNELTAAYDGSNNVNITWTRRSRADVQWVDGVETAELDESSEQYLLWITNQNHTLDTSDSTSFLRSTIVTSPSFEYTTAMQTADGFNNTTDTLIVLVAQIGSYTNSIGYTASYSLPPL